MRAVPVLAMGALLVAACGADEPEITIVAPGATRVLIKQGGAPHVDLEPGDDVRVAVDGPFEIVAVCHPDVSSEPFVHVIRADLDDGAVWNVGRCDPPATLQRVILDQQYTDFYALSVGALGPQSSRDELRAPAGRQDLFVEAGGTIRALRDFEVTAGAVLPWEPGFEASELAPGATATVLTRRATRFQAPGWLPTSSLESGDRQWITRTGSYDSGTQSMGFTRFTTGADLPEWDPSQTDLNLVGALDGGGDAELSSTRVAVRWAPDNAWDDQLFTTAYGSDMRWTIEAHRGWVQAEPGRDRELVFDTADILGWDDSIEQPTGSYELWLGRTQEHGTVVGVAGYGSP